MWSVWGVVALAVFLGLLCVVWLEVSYDGNCGGALPWLAAARPCSRADFVINNTLLLALMMGTEFWPFIVAAIALIVGVAYFLDRRVRSRAT
jgi:hypothetical protein